MKHIEGIIADLKNKRFFKGRIYFDNKIKKIEETNTSSNIYILPCLIDSHVHIESSMLSPLEFTKAIITKGTIGVIADPHEIANVCGLKGINFMINNSKKFNAKIYFTAPSCVPATTFETSGAQITANDIETLFKNYPEIIGLGEVMNYPAVINEEPEMINKINIAKKYNKAIDGHAPLLTGENLKKYISYNISTDHECSSLEEALEKIKLGMKIQIREGSAAKNLDSLYELFHIYPDKLMLCTDDIHPDDLINGHINLFIKKLVDKKIDYFDVLKAASLTPIKHYNLPIGTLTENSYADFVICNDIFYEDIKEVYVNGKKIYPFNKNMTSDTEIINNWQLDDYTLTNDSLQVEIDKDAYYNVIGYIKDQLITEHLKYKYIDIFYNDKKFNKDFSKIVVINRYKKAKPIVGIIKNFSLKEGAIGSSISHDSHNIIICGVEDEHIIKVFDLINKHKGGIAISTKDYCKVLPLPIAGLMTNTNIKEVATTYSELNNYSKSLFYQNITSPFMALSFFSLLVIPELKIGDKGLFNIKYLKFFNLIQK